MLALFALVSSALVWSVPRAQAHEVDPTVADLSVQDGVLTLSLRLTLESFIAGIDLDATTNINDAAQAETYDGLRALGPDALAARFDEFAPQMLARLSVEVDGAAVALVQTDLDIPDVADVELPRAAQLALSGPIDPEAIAVTVLWPDGYGTLILRQIGVEAGYTGYLSGGQASPEITVRACGWLFASSDCVTYQ